MSQLDLFVPKPAPDAPAAAAAPDPERRGWAEFSACGLYRYTLGRVIDPANPRTVTMILANPSKAGADGDDNTSSKAIGFAQRWGFGRLVIVNARSYIATFPKDMDLAESQGVDVVGPDNEGAIRRGIGHALLNGAEQGKPPIGLLMLGCGKDVGEDRMAEIMRVVRFCGLSPMCLGTNKNGTPKHPLYLSYETPLVPFVWPPGTAT